MIELDSYIKPAILILTALLLFIWAIYVVFIHKKFQGRIYKVYFSYVLCLIVWTLSNAYFQSHLLPALGSVYAVKMALVANFFSCLAALLGLYFSCLLKHAGPIKPWERLSLALFLTINIIFNVILPDEIVVDVKISGPGSFLIVQGPLNPFFFLSGIIIVILTFRNFLALRKRALKVEQKKAHYMLLGICILVFSIMIFHILIPGIFNSFDFAWVPPIFSLGEALLFGYALLFQRFYSHKLIVQKITIQAINISFYFIPFLIVANFLRINQPPILVLSICFFVFGFLYYRERRKTLKFIDKYWTRLFYRDRTQAERIRSASNAMEMSHEKGLFQLSSALNTNGAEIVARHDPRFQSLIQHAQDPNKEYVRDEIEYHLKQTRSRKTRLKHLIEIMDQLQVSLLIPLFRHSEIFGFMAIKPKNSGTLFYADEIRAARRFSTNIKQIPNTPIKKELSLVSTYKESFLYIESQNRQVILYDEKQGKINLDISLKAICDYFPDLIRISRSCVVNPKKIAAVYSKYSDKKKTTVYIVSVHGKDISVGKTYLPKIKEGYSDMFLK